MTRTESSQRRSQGRPIHLTRVSFALFLTPFLYVIADQTVMIALANYLPKIAGDSSSLYGLTTSFLFLGNIIMVIPLARLSEKIGRKYTLLFSNCFMAIGVFSLYFADNLLLIFLARFIVGFNSTKAVTTALIHDLYPAGKRSSILGLQFIAVVVGFLIASVIGGIFYSWLGDHVVFLLAGGFVLIMILNTVVFIQNAPKSHKADLPLKKSSISNTIRDHLLPNKPLLWGFILNFLGSICFGGAGSYSTYMIFIYYNQPAETGGLFGLGATIMEMIIFLYVGAKVKDFSKFYKFLMVVALIFGGFAIILLAYDTIWIFAIAVTFVGILLAGMTLGSDSVTLHLIPEENKSDLIGLYRFLTLVGTMIGPTLFGLMVDYIWPFFPAVFMMLMAILSAFIYLRWIKS